MCGMTEWCVFALYDIMMYGSCIVWVILVKMKCLYHSSYIFMNYCKVLANSYVR